MILSTILISVVLTLQRRGKFGIKITYSTWKQKLQSNTKKTNLNQILIDIVSFLIYLIIDELDQGKVDEISLKIKISVRTKSRCQKCPGIEHKYNSAHKKLTKPSSSCQIELFLDKICTTPICNQHTHISGEPYQIKYPFDPFTFLLSMHFKLLRSGIKII